MRGRSGEAKSDGGRLTGCPDRVADARGMGEVQFEGDHFGVRRS
ncbi:hypothetical protein SAMN05660859_2101 [Ancylobacter rudongensis]|uniref:Uncharacterized protein n=1 Tax=Ancylobacter rudongensis TaxID=177413 RepID=A0A1G4SCJ6_9HYPH|nr:hypothetical protein SAMN05660859_2101 [Ancylobacter rudongensis]